MRTPDPNDHEFEEYALEGVTQGTNGYTIRFDGTRVLGVDNTVIPRIGDTVRLYGPGFGRPVRGIVIRGCTVYYRTPKEQIEKQERESKRFNHKLPAMLGC